MASHSVKARLGDKQAILPENFLKLGGDIPKFVETVPLRKAVCRQQCWELGSLRSQAARSIAKQVMVEDHAIGDLFQGGGEFPDVCQWQERTHRGLGRNPLFPEAPQRGQSFAGR